MKVDGVANTVKAEPIKAKSGEEGFVGVLVEMTKLMGVTVMRVVRVILELDEPVDVTTSVVSLIRPAACWTLKLQVERMDLPLQKSLMTERTAA